tara:strand:+ start:685 stop:1143 length:459 start_codon:yes stop_codon:yes gene_type:complete
MENKKNITILSSIIFEPCGNILDNKINLNLHLIPNISELNCMLIEYCYCDEELKKFFFKKQNNYKVYLKNKLPINIVNNILSFSNQIKSYILHLIYNNWHKNFIDILFRIKDDYELYSAWTNDYEHSIFFYVEEKIREVNGKFKGLLSSIDI